MKAARAAFSSVWVWAVLGALILTTVLAANAARLFFASKPGDGRAEAVKVAKSSIALTVTAGGTIHPIKEVKISPETTGLIEKVFVEQGDEVKAGDVLVQMDDADARGQAEAARGAYLIAQDNFIKAVHGNRPQEVAIAAFQEKRARDIVRQAEQNLLRLKNQIESLNQQLVRDDTFADRQAYLRERGAVSEQDCLNAETQANMTHANLESARGEISQGEATLAQNKTELETAHEQYLLVKSGTREEEIMAAKHAVIQAKGTLDSLQDRLTDMVIRAPFAGVITRKYADAGAIATPTSEAGSPSAILGLAGRLEMVARIPESEISSIYVGQPVEFTTAAYPTHLFRGRVTLVGSEAIQVADNTTFEVHCAINGDGRGIAAERTAGGIATDAHSLAGLDNHSRTQVIGPASDLSYARSSARKLLSGMKVSAKFTAGRLDNVLVVPSMSIIFRSGTNGVMVIQPDGTRRFKEVKVGASDGVKTVVLTGLEEGEAVSGSAPDAAAHV